MIMILDVGGKTMKKLPFWHYLLWFLGSVALGLALLLLCACLPQGPIDAHVKDAALALNGEGAYPRVFDTATTAQLDNYTDAIIMDVSRGTTASRISSVLTNPVHRGAEDPVEALAIYAAQEADARESFFYPRYWMGFRVLTRAALVFLNYLQIRRYLGFLLLGLMLLTVLSVAGHADRRAAFLFGLSLLLVRPQVICHSLQFSCCFFLALLGMLAIPRLRRKRRWEGLFFMEMGILTMYFDFYTAPLLTFGLPMVYLCLLDARERETLSAKRVLADLGLWLGGYVLMWLAKLTLTTVFTSENAFESGFSTLLMWAGGKGTGAAPSLMRALQAVRHAVTVDTPGAFVWAGALLCALLMLGLCAGKGRLRRRPLREQGALLLLALLPLLWFAATARPTEAHAWFQYRSIALSYWALGAWLSLLLPGPGTEKVPAVRTGEGSGG